MAFRFGPFRIVPAERVVEKHGERVQIGSRAFDLLLVLVENSGEVVSKKQLTSRAWPDTVVDEVSLRVHISGLRKTLGKTPLGTPYITNVSGRGYMLVVPAERDDAPPQLRPVRAAAMAASLPPRLFRMVGRDQCVREVEALLGETRFVSIVGVGGLGKTTVAVAVAHELRERFDDGAFFVDLASVSDGELVPSTIASLFGISVTASDQVPSLVSFLRQRRVLVVLDNAEHLIDDVAVLAERIFEHCPGVHILTTTREALRVEGEHIYTLAALEIPPLEAGRGSRDITDYSSVRLFIDRAFASGGRRELEEPEAQIAAEICRRLDGVALAIELAAGRAATHGVAGVLDLLDRRFGLHWQGRRTALPRHQTLAALHDWSYNLLDDDEKLVLRRVGCFAGPFTNEAARTVVGDQWPVTRIIDALSEKSLVSRVVGPDGRIAYRLAETTRAYCVDKLRTAPDEQTKVSAAHALYYTELLEGLVGGRDFFRVTGLTAIKPELLGNIRQALEWCFNGGDTKLGVRLVASSVPLLLELSLLAECHSWASLAVEVMPPELVGTLQDATINQALAISGIIVRDAQGKVKQAFARALEIARALQHKRLELDILAGMNIFVMRAGDCYAGSELAIECEQAGQGINDGDVRALVSWIKGIAYSYAGECGAAIRCFELGCAQDAPPGLDLNLVVFTQRIRAIVQYARCLMVQGSASLAKRTAARAVQDATAYGHPIPRCIALAYAASTYIWKGDWDDAISLADELATVSQQHSLTAFHAVSTGLKGELDVRRGLPSEGIRQLREALAIMTAENHHHMVVSFLAALAEGLADTGEHAEALVTLARAMARAEESGEMFQMVDMVGLKASIELSTGPHEAASIVPVMEALALARKENALTLELRIALRAVRDEQSAVVQSSQLAQEIKSIISRFGSVQDTQDLRIAGAILSKSRIGRDAAAG
ncbi:winged helix-turn-helix domain-containing protein [Sinorhizobium garamanticum]|uniref:Winged helix-turn-helix domain-containing protein n=1 Tax=Sinorhizobium garamanticum TaxID=680247 RepID=A0ABY8DIZ6_9HYPH|nr:winged helix-turn-helix domain-containing protein [Sinorhizobium garamanticum]WEX90891.1 winged helix-turn-helix domain-containing protein [Sinorhizobium garamanticum]